MVDAAILAGGQAERLAGADKARLLIDGTPLIGRQLAALSAVATHIFIVARDRERYAELGLPVYEDLVAAGALGGIYTALMAASADRVIVVACDMPFLNPRFLQHLVDAAGDEVDAAVPRTAGRYQPLCAVYSRGCAEVIRRRIDAGALQVKGLFADLRTRVVEPEEIAPYDPDGMLFFNVNTPADYARACDFVRRQHSRFEPTRLRGAD